MRELTLRLGPWDQRKKDLEYSRCIGIYYFLNELNAVLILSFRLSGSTLSLFRYLITAVIFFSFIRCIIHFRKHEFQSLIIAVGFMFFLYVYSWLVGSKADLLIDWGITTFGICVPLGVFAYNIFDKDVLYNELLKFSLPVLVLLIINLSGSQLVNYDMHFSYMLLYVIVFHISFIMRKRKYFVVPLVLLELIMLLVFGSRGALLCIFVFIVLKILSNMESISKRIIYIFVAILVVVLVQYLLSAYGPLFLAKARELGFISRSLGKILDGSLTTYDSGRSIIWQSTLELIKQAPFLGYGIRGAVDYLFSSYPHQLFLDLWLSFGVIFGSLIGLLVLIPSRKLLIGKYSISKELIHIFFSISFVMLMISGTVFTSYNFFIYMGLILSKPRLEQEAVN